MLHCRYIILSRCVTGLPQLWYTLIFVYKVSCHRRSGDQTKTREIPPVYMDPEAACKNARKKFTNLHVCTITVFIDIITCVGPKYPNLSYC